MEIFTAFPNSHPLAAEFGIALFMNSKKEELSFGTENDVEIPPKIRIFGESGFLSVARSLLPKEKNSNFHQPDICVTIKEQSSNSKPQPADSSSKGK